MVARRRVTSLLLLALAGFGFRAFVSPPRPAAASAAGTAGSLVALSGAAAAWAEEELDEAAKALMDATQENFDVKTGRPQIDLGEYRGDSAWTVIGIIGGAFLLFSTYESLVDEYGEGLVPKSTRTTSDDYFNPDFDPYRGMNIKKKEKTEKKEEAV
mmetsp:Transcript_62098/g.116129  ORF Transcript_62098/g.116129 Transcript_62098/m.116129 type:complete len:157 (+) Transcript_62098:42-512(+)